MEGLYFRRCHIDETMVGRKPGKKKETAKKTKEKNNTSKGSSEGHPFSPKKRKKLCGRRGKVVASEKLHRGMKCSKR